MSNKKIILFGAGHTGLAAVKLYGKDNVAAFADNNKTGEYCGLPIISLSELVRRQDAYRIVITSDLYAKEIEKILEDAGIRQYEIFKDQMPNRKADTAKLASYKGINIGKRCFIIGTGPSLTMDDLNTLNAHNELCIGTNKIFLAFDKTVWRPNYYIVIDIRQEEQYKQEIADLHIKDKFVAIKRTSYWNSSLSDDAIAFSMIGKAYTTDEMPSFSDDICVGIHEGNTVTYAAIQLAAYMGFSEIYLLGVDFDYSGNTEKGENHFIGNYMKKDEVYLMTNPELILLAYQKAELFSREHGFRIYNATRGGKLAVFERVDFDRLF